MIYALQTSKSRLQLYCIVENYPKKRQWELKRDRWKVVTNSGENDGERGQWLGTPWQASMEV
jgi:hypothetical protein